VIGHGGGGYFEQKEAKGAKERGWKADVHLSKCAGVCWGVPGKGRFISRKFEHYLANVKQNVGVGNILCISKMRGPRAELASLL